MNFATNVTDPDPRIRTLDYGSGSSFESGSCYFDSDFQDANEKISISLKDNKSSKN
jgi:hypothetical protein